MSSLPEFTDGPDRWRGGMKCPDHHDGVREGLSDWCCCCNPCLYERSPDLSDRGVAPWEEKSSCCRCVPQSVCMVFTPDPTANPCCREYAYTAFPVHAQGFQTTYTFYFGTTRLTWDIRYHKPDAYDDSTVYCTWDFLWVEFIAQVVSTVYAEESYVIDHVNTTCLKMPDILIDNVTDDLGCVGSITFVPYEGNKIPFQNQFRELVDEPDIVIPDSPCDCVAAAPVLCVSGIRHVDGEFGLAEFSWNEGLGDRWEYLPACGNPSTDREVIYLRGDYYGNCYLELDFEQSGGDTNDWTDPPNTLGVDEQEVRDGLIPVETCGHCGFVVRAQSTGGRAITITSGHCSRWAYICGTCRCVPNTLCLIGEIDGQLIDNVVATWDANAKRWIADAGGYVGELRLGLARDCDNCVGMIENHFAVDFANGEAPIRCDRFLTFELESVFDEAQPEAYNWLWASSGMCGCIPHICGICSTERCGNSPQILYADLQGRNPEDCNVTIELHRWERFPVGSPTTECGYIGYYVYTCDGNTFQIRFEILPAFNMLITKTLLNGSYPQAQQNGDILNLALFNGETVTPDPGNCDPIFYEIPWGGVPYAPVGVDNCPWGCKQIMDIQLTIME